MDGDLAGCTAPVEAEAPIAYGDRSHCFRRRVRYRLRWRRIVFLFTPNDHARNSGGDIYSNRYGGLWQLEPQHNDDRSRAVEYAPIWR
jgi:hypothetical protein